MNKLKIFNFKNMDQRKAMFRFIDNYEGECVVHLDNTITSNGKLIAKIIFEPLCTE